MANHGCKEIQQSQELGEVSETGHCKDKKRDHGRLRPQLESINQSPPNLMKSVQTNAVFFIFQSLLWILSSRNFARCLQQDMHGMSFDACKCQVIMKFQMKFQSSACVCKPARKKTDSKSARGHSVTQGSFLEFAGAKVGWDGVARRHSSKSALGPKYTPNES
jgi:hypothetical protein